MFSIFGSAACQESKTMALEDSTPAMSPTPIGLTQSLVAGRTIAAAAVQPGEPNQEPQNPNTKPSQEPNLLEINEKSSFIESTSNQSPIKFRPVIVPYLESNQELQLGPNLKPTIVSNIKQNEELNVGILPKRVVPNPPWCLEIPEAVLSEEVTEAKPTLDLNVEITQTSNRECLEPNPVSLLPNPDSTLESQTVSSTTTLDSESNSQETKSPELTKEQINIQILNTLSVKLEYVYKLIIEFDTRKCVNWDIRIHMFKQKLERIMSIVEQMKLPKEPPIKLHKL